MQMYDPKAQKKATNLSLNSDLLAQAKSLKINLSATLEKSLSEEVQKRKEQLWLKENKAAIEEFNARVEEHGVFGENYRVF